MVMKIFLQGASTKTFVALSGFWPLSGWGRRGLMNPLKKRSNRDKNLFFK